MNVFVSYEPTFPRGATFLGNSPLKTSVTVNTNLADEDLLYAVVAVTLKTEVARAMYNLREDTAEDLNSPLLSFSLRGFNRSDGTQVNQTTDVFVFFPIADVPRGPDEIIIRRSLKSGESKTFVPGTSKCSTRYVNT